MPCFYFKCYNCNEMFVTGNEVPGGLSCAIGQCDIQEITREEAEKAVEEMRDE